MLLNQLALLSLAVVVGALAGPRVGSNGFAGLQRPLTNAIFNRGGRPLPFHSRTTLYLKAIGVENGTSQPECWGILPNYTVGTLPPVLGTLGVSLGAVQKSSYLYFPHDYSAPLHGPGANQYVVFLSGAALIWFPNATATIPCVAGDNLVVVDNSSVSTGHGTHWTAGTAIMLVQLQDGIAPSHTIVDTAYCGY